MSDFLTPVGRLVGGDLFKGSTTDSKGQPRVYKSGPNAGQPRTEFWFSLALPKNSPDVVAFIQARHVEARTAWPQFFDPAGNCLRRDFASKIIDGDSTEYNQSMKRWCDYPGYAGHWVLRFSGSYAPKVVSTGGKRYITDPEEVKPGYWIRVSGSSVSNNSQQTPGMHLNHSLVEFVAYGEVIEFGADPTKVFAQPVVALPPGASAIPLAPANAPVVAPPVAPVAPAIATHYPVPGVTPPAVPALQGIVPAHDFLTPSAPPVEPVYRHPSGATYTASQLAAANWTPEQIAALPRV